MLDAQYGVDARQALALYVPVGRHNVPLVVFIHDGRWFRGGKEQAADYGRFNAMLAAGFAVATINYRYSTTAIRPAQPHVMLRFYELR
jgi:acetyl esterase/lipase